MPKIQDGFNTVKVELPSYKGSEVILKTNVPISDVMDVKKNEDELELTVMLLTRMIVDWNFDDEAGNKLAISVENLRQFPILDITALQEKIMPFIQKKTLSEKTK